MNNKICVGLDLKYNSPFSEYTKIISQTKDLAFCYKINPAFFLNDNIKIQKIANYLNNLNLKWIYDGKTGDVLHTNEKYSKYIYEILNASGCTLNPYLGYDSLYPFLQKKDKINFLLCRTTNLGSNYIQSQSYQKVYSLANIENSGLVIAANKEYYLKDAIENCPNSLILSPGIGVQGGKINKCIDNKNIIYNISRSIINSKNPRLELEKYVKQ